MGMRGTDRVMVCIFLGVITLALLISPLFIVRRVSGSMSSGVSAQDGGIPAPVSFIRIPHASAAEAPRSGSQAFWSHLERNADGSWKMTLKVALRGGARWDKLAVTAQVLSHVEGQGPWTATVVSELPQDGVPDVVDVSFQTGPIAGSAEDLGLKVECEYRTDGWLDHSWMRMSATYAMGEGESPTAEVQGGVRR